MEELCKSARPRYLVHASEYMSANHPSHIRSRLHRRYPDTTVFMGADYLTLDIAGIIRARLLDTGPSL